jgi:hypothetical protein
VANYYIGSCSHSSSCILLHFTYALLIVCSCSGFDGWSSSIVTLAPAGTASIWPHSRSLPIAS